MSSLHSIFDLRPGHFLTFTSHDDELDLVLSAVIRVRSSGRVLGLVACKQIENLDGFRLQKNFAGRVKEVGSLKKFDEYFDYSGHLDSLFALVHFAPNMIGEIEKNFKVAAISKDFRVNAFNSNGMKVRRIVGSYVTNSKKKFVNKRENRVTHRGLVCGDVTNARIKTKCSKTQVEYAGLIRNKTSVSFARFGDGGKPVVSSSNALLGFVVASNEEKTLMLTAEDISDDLDVDFLVPDKKKLPQTNELQIRAKK